MKSSRTNLRRFRSSGNHSMVAATPLFGAMLWRLWKADRVGIFIVPFAGGLVVLAAGLTLIYAPFLLTGPTRHALQATATAYRFLPPNQAMLMALVAQQVPFLIALFTALAGSAAGQRAVGDEASRGSLEILLAGPFTIVQIAGALLCSAVSATIISSVIVIASAGFSSILLLASKGLLHAVPFGVFLSYIPMQIGMALLSAEMSVLIALVLPKFAELRAGLSASPAQLVAALPALGLFILVNLRTSMATLRVAEYSAAAAIAIALVGGLLLPRMVQTEVFLES